VIWTDNATGNVGRPCKAHDPEKGVPVFGQDHAQDEGGLTMKYQHLADAISRSTVGVTRL